MTKATKTKRPTKLDRLLAQGRWIEADVNGRKVPYFAMPTADLQRVLNEEFEKKIRKRLKDGGFERICATQREHPGHSELLRERIDKLASFSGGYDPTLEKEAGRKNYAKTIRAIEAKFGVASPKEIMAEHVEKAIQKNHRAWTAAFNKYRNMLRDLKWWKGTYLYRTIFPENGPPLPDGAPPKPVFVSKHNPNLVLALQDGFVKMWVKA
jgi:hypothetical protein